MLYLFFILGCVDSNLDKPTKSAAVQLQENTIKWQDLIKGSEQVKYMTLTDRPFYQQDYQRWDLSGTWYRFGKKEKSPVTFELRDGNLVMLDGKVFKGEQVADNEKLLLFVQEKPDQPFSQGYYNLYRSEKGLEGVVLWKGGDTEKAEYVLLERL